MGAKDYDEVVRELTELLEKRKRIYGGVAVKRNPHQQYMELKGTGKVLDKEKTFQEKTAEKKQENRRMERKMPDVLDSMSPMDLYQLRLRCRPHIESMSWMSKKEEKIVSYIQRGERTRFRQEVWMVTGEIDTQEILENYNKTVEKVKAFRTYLMYRNLSRGVKVVNEPERSSFPIVNLKDFEDEKREHYIGSFLLAEARREYDPEQDAAVKLHGFLVEENRMIVVTSVYPSVSLDMDVHSILLYVFRGLHLNQKAGTVDSLRNTAGKMAERMADKSEVKKTEYREEEIRRCLAYWKKTLEPLGRSLSVPGELTSKRQMGKSSAYKEMPSALQEEIKKFCGQKHVSVKALLLTTFAKLLCSYQNVSDPVLAVSENGERMNWLPVRFFPRESLAYNEEKMLEQIQNGKENSVCTTDDLSRTMGVAMQTHFRVLHNFITFDKKDVADDRKVVTGELLDENEGSLETALKINYYCIGDKMEINYIYQKDRFYDEGIDNLHQIFQHMLEEVLSFREPKFDKNSYISESDSDEEKIRKLEVAQRALYIQQTELFNNRIVEELMKLAECCRHTRYSINDVVLDENKKVCEVGILAEGRLEESRTARDGAQKSVSLLKPKRIFALDSLCDNNENKFTYTVASNEAKVVWIERDVLMDFLNQHPDNWKSIVEVLCESSKRMKMLWVTV